MGGKGLRVIAFLAGVVLLVAAIKAVNWLPAAIQSDVLREYGSMEEVRASVALGDVYVPSYYPQELGWPPAAILAQGRPFPALVLEFARSEGRDTALVVVQTASGWSLPEGRIRMATTQESVRYSLQGRQALLTVGTSPAGDRVSRIVWTEGKYRIDIAAKAPPVELVKVAESMLR